MQSKIVRQRVGFRYCRVEIYYDSNNRNHNSKLNQDHKNASKSLNHNYRSMFLLGKKVLEFLEKNSIKEVDSIKFFGPTPYFYFVVKDLLWSEIRIETVIDETFRNRELNRLLGFMSTFVSNYLDSHSGPIFPFNHVICEACNKHVLNYTSITSNDNLDVIIPTKDVPENDLLRLIDQVNFQLHPKDHIIIVDDNETKLSSEFYSMTSDTIKIIRGEKAGVGAARQLGLNAGTAKLILFIDSDDQILDKFISIQRKMHIKFSNIAATGTWIQAFGSHNSIYPQWDGFRTLGMLQCLPPAGILMWKREAINLLNGFNSEFKQGFEDFDLVSRAILNNMVITVADQVKYLYKKGHNSLSQTWSQESENVLRGKVWANIQNVCAHNFVEAIEIASELGPYIKLGSPDRAYTFKNSIIPTDFILKYRNNSFIRPIWNKLPLSLKALLYNYILH